MTTAVDIKLRLDNERLSRDLAKAKRDFAKLKDGASKDFSDIGGAWENAMADIRGEWKSVVGMITVPVAVLAGLTQAVSLVRNVAKEISDLNDAANSLGVSFESFQVLEFAANQSGVRLEKLTASMGKMQAVLGEVADGGAPAAAKTLKTLGLSITDLMTLDPDKQFDAIANALERVENPAQRAALGLDIFGRGFRELNPLINDNGQSLDDWTVKARRAGVIIDEETRVKLARFDDTMEQFDQTTRKAKAEALTPFAEFLTKYLTFAIDDSISSLDRLKVAFASMNYLAMTKQVVNLGVEAGKARTQDAPSTETANAQYKALQALRANERAKAADRAAIIAEAQEKAAKAAAVNGKKVVTDIAADQGRAAAEAFAKAQREAAEQFAGLEKFLAISNEYGSEQEQADYAYGKKRAEIILAGIAAGYRADSKEVQDLLSKYDESLANEKTDKLMADAEATREKLRAIKQEEIDYYNRLGEAVGDSVGGALASIITKAQTAEEALKGLVAQLLIAIAKAAILRAFGEGGSGGFWSSVGNVIAGGLGRSGPGVRIINMSGGGVQTRSASNGDIEVVIGAVAQAISRGGNPLSLQLERTYGIGRRG